MCDVTNVAGVEQEQEIATQEIEEIRREEARDYVISLLSRFPQTNAEKRELFECFGLDVPIGTPDDWVNAYIGYVSGRLGGYVWHLVFATSQIAAPTVFAKNVGSATPQLAKYIEAVYDGDRKLARRLAKEQRILEQCAPPQ